MSNTILWRRIDLPGHDACTLRQLDDGWRLEGTALFALEGNRCNLRYRVECDRSWKSRSGRVDGWMGDEPVRLEITRTAGFAWSLNGIAQKGADGCADLDLGFTPSTNLFQIRRLALNPGEAADAPAAWLPFPAMELQRLEHRYHLLEPNRYDYDASGVGYTGILETTEAGFVTVYPELWEAECVG